MTDIAKNEEIRASEAMKVLTRIMVGCIIIATTLVFCMPLDSHIYELRNITLGAMVIIMLMTFMLGGIVVFSEKGKLKKMEIFIGLLLCVIFIVAGTNSIKKDIVIKKLQEAQVQIQEAQEQIDELKEHTRELDIDKHEKIIRYTKHNTEGL